MSQGHDEEPQRAVAAVRRRPAMYVGGVDGDGVLNLVLELIANACDQHLAGRCSQLELEIAADGTITVQDDGPGLPVEGDAGLPSIERLLTTHSDRPTLDGHRPHVHLGFGGSGLFVVNALSERFMLATVRDGIEATVVYARGALVEPLTRTPARRASGTMVRFRPDAQIFAHARVPRAALTQRLEDLSFLLPKLTLRWRVAGDDIAAGGLASRVALGAGRALASVAHHRASCATASGPVDVEVAIAWSDPPRQASPVCESFVNFERSPGDGTHVDGLMDGVAAFLGRAPLAGLVAAVAVVLPDVQWGAPTKERLVSPEARAPVAEVTQVALAQWAEAQPALADAIRAHHRPR